MERKEFIKLASAGIFCGGIIPVLEGCVTYRYAESALEGDKLVVEKKVFQKDLFVLVHNPQASSPIYLRKDADERYTALLLECTHKQCTVNPDKETLSCPCHGSRYDAKGNVLEGPARKPLMHYKVDSDDTNIYIQLS